MGQNDCDICGQPKIEENYACPQHRAWRFERERNLEIRRNEKLRRENQRLRAELEKAIERLEQGKPCLAKNILYCALDRPQQDGDGLEGMSMLRFTLDQGGE